MLTTGGQIRFSTDTLTFDTVFTQTGSFTLGLKLFNTESSPVTLSSVRLEKAGISPFRINVNGIPGPVVKDIEIAANDSIYVFATVRINPDTTNAPFIVEDRLLATLNGKDFAIPLIAYGQNAHYIVNEDVSNAIWGADDTKPYVLVGKVDVLEGKTLTIRKGTRLYMHADCRLAVYGTLKALGSKEDSIIFQGDRLDRAYFGVVGYPGEWGGIYFAPRSTNNVLQHCILKNGGNSARNAFPALIQVSPDSVADVEPQLRLDRVTIENSIGYGLLSFNGTVRGDNVLIHSCGAQALAVLYGGADTFNNCTFVIQNPPRVTHTDQPTVALLNSYEYEKNKFLDAPLSAVLRNCIIWGSLEDEIVSYNRKAAAYNVILDHCLLKSATASAVSDALRVGGPANNTDPQFTDASKQDYHLKSSSPLKNAGTSISGDFSGLDRDDVPRNGQWDIGCYRVP
jgi:hypothetical protein